VPSSVLVVAPSSAVDPEEARLLEVMVAGRRAADLMDEAAPERRAELVAAVRAAEEARSDLVQAHQGLVAKLAYRYRSSGVPMADLMQEGNVGLLAALDRFDPAAGRFASFAWYWVRQMILAAIPRHRQGFCLSSGVARQVYRVRQVRTRLEAELGREASLAEMSAECKLSEARVAQLEALTMPHHALNETVSSTLIDPAEDGDPSYITGKRQEAQAVHELLDELPARERSIIRRRYGLGSAPERLTEIAETLGVSASRVCQIEREALQRLRRLAASRQELLPAA
jgi:RNA polymerase sigma factor (sigma-70 family)